MASDIVLKNVLVVPTFQYNLLSVAQLTHDTSSTVSFTPSKCQLQDSLLKRGGEIGDLCDGLYKLSTVKLNSTHIISPTALQSSHTESSIVKWHRRFGHPSLNVLKPISTIDLSFKSVLPDCEICHLAKQVRLPFPVRNSVSTDLFEIINCDVWGPYKHFTHGHCNQFLTIVDDYSLVVSMFI